MLVYTWDSLYCSMLILYCPQIKSNINHKSGCVLARIWQYGAYHYTRVISMYGDTVGKAILQYLSTNQSDKRHEARSTT